MGNPIPDAHADDERWGPWRCQCGHKSTEHHWADDDKGNCDDWCEQCDCRRLIEYREPPVRSYVGPSV